MCFSCCFHHWRLSLKSPVLHPPTRPWWPGCCPGSLSRRWSPLSLWQIEGQRDPASLLDTPLHAASPCVFSSAQHFSRLNMASSLIRECGQLTCRVLPREEYLCRLLCIIPSGNQDGLMCGDSLTTLIGVSLKALLNVINYFDTDLTLFISMILLGLALPEFWS